MLQCGPIMERVSLLVALDSETGFGAARGQGLRVRR